YSVGRGLCCQWDRVERQHRDERERGARDTRADRHRLLLLSVAVTGTASSPSLIIALFDTNVWISKRVCMFDSPGFAARPERSDLAASLGASSCRRTAATIRRSEPTLARN